jgi:alkanesulfonate monooxygenase SsuD/methylene tetrahydromethanopterin reductase-like flavin-dependent oxidoreductase (luciferase family)
MRYAVNVLNFSALGHPHSIQEIARRAEAAGWDGLFTWDHVLTPWSPDTTVYDPWTLLAGAACVTERILLGTNVTPVPRRRPRVLANQVATVDELSGGRAVLGVGIGGHPPELEVLGEETDAVRRGDALDAALPIIRERWPDGRIWGGGDSGRAKRRAATLGGWTTGLLTDERGTMGVTPELLAAKVDAVPELRRGEILVEGYSEVGDGELVASYEAVGATWWCDSLNLYRATAPELLARVDAGPPR